MEPTPTGNTITFNYEGIAAAVAKTAIPDNIKTVKFAFVDEDDNVIGKTKTLAIENNLVVDDGDMASGMIDPEAVIATAVYYNADNDIVALGVDEISWTITTTNAEGFVEPEIFELGDDYSFTITTSSSVIKPGEGLQLSAIVTTERGMLELTSLVEFSFTTGDGSDPGKVLIPEGTGAYTGGEYGVVQVSASLDDGSLEAELDDSVYVTDQTITGLTVEPKDELTQVDYDDKSKGYPVVVVDKPMEQTTADFYNENDGTLTKTDIKSVPLVVKAVYSNEEGKGPSPSSVDVTSSSILDIVFGDDTPADPTVNVFIGGISIVSLTNGEGRGPDLYKVTASCTIDGQTVTTLEGKEAYLVGTSAGSGVVLTAKDPSAPQGVSMYGTAAPGDDVDLHLTGFFEGGYGVYYFEIPEGYIPETAPQASIDYVSPEGADLGEINPAGGDTTIDYTLGIDDNTEATGASIGVDTQGTELPDASVFTLTVEQ